MNRPLVIAYHLIWTAYGCWLPNDPRGSGSKEIESDVLAELGEMHFGRKAIQPPACDLQDFYQSAKDVLSYPLLVFDEAARLGIAKAFAKVIQEQRYTCYACAIMPDHVHILMRKHKHQVETMVDALKSESRHLLIASGARADYHPTWADGHGWRVFLEHPDEIRRTIRYIRQNPDKAGLEEQPWPFVKDFDGWPLHPGHSPNSPYAKRLRAAGRYP